MYNSKKIYFLIVFILFFTGCSQLKEQEIPKQKPITQESIKKVEKQTVVKNIKKKKPIVKKINKYKYCNKHKKIMSYARTYIFSEFEKGYFSSKDIVGAKAQLYLIENKSPTIFSKNINRALDSYKAQYSIAKKNKCSLKGFEVSPLNSVKNKLNIIEKKLSLEKKDK